jgi:subtilisin-like proprotein convertase family protein
MKRTLLATLLAAAAAILLAPMGASADVYRFKNTTEIDIPLSGSASPFPSTIHVAGVRGPIANVEVDLSSVTHGNPQDLDVLLVPPDGHGAILMSDACGTQPVTRHTWTFVAAGDQPLPSMGDTCPDTFYRPTDLSGESDFWPGVDPAYTAFSMTDWLRKPMNGDWKLYVVDDGGNYAGKIENGWKLRFTTKPVDAFVPAVGTSGVADHYPLTTTIAAPADGVVADVAVTLQDTAADHASDLNLLLEGPQGQNVMLMAGACAGSKLDTPSLRVTQDAFAPLPETGGCGAVASPANYRANADMPPPAPRGFYGASLGTFSGTPPNGDWKLYAYDSGDGGNGYIGHFALEVTTREKGKIRFADSAITVPEGTTPTVKIERFATSPVGPADVTVTTTPGTATAGADFTPISKTVHFDQGETDKTVALDAIDDGAAEPDETYTVKLTNAGGDAQLGARSQVDVTIPASTGKPDSRPGPPPPIARCDGKVATIVGTAGKDVLRGTRGTDVIVGLGGNDTITAVKGNDTVCGGAGKDVLSGGAGRDRLLGGPGNDRLTGGAGRDTCLGGRGRNRVTCERKTGA